MSGWAGDAAYNAAAETYNAEATKVFQDWALAGCPNWRPVVLRLGSAAIQRVADAYFAASSRLSPGAAPPGLAALRAAGLTVGGDAKLLVEAFEEPNDVSSSSSDVVEVDDPDAEDASSRRGHRVRPGDALWTVSVAAPASALPSPRSPRRGPPPGGPPAGTRPQPWSTRRFYADSAAAAGSLLAQAALDCCDPVDTEPTPVRAGGGGGGGGGDDDGTAAGAAAGGRSVGVAVRQGAKLALVLRRGCGWRLATSNALGRHLAARAAPGAGCDASGALAAGLTLLAQDRPPDPNRDQPINSDKLSGTVCFICRSHSHPKSSVSNCHSFGPSMTHEVLFTAIKQP
jgi:hypothetical protein